MPFRDHGTGVRRRQWRRAKNLGDRQFQPVQALGSAEYHPGLPRRHRKARPGRQTGIRDSDGTVLDNPRCHPGPPVRHHPHSTAVPELQQEPVHELVLHADLQLP